MITRFLNQFFGGNSELRKHLNSVVDAVNVLLQIKGDGGFIKVEQSGVNGGLVVSLDIGAVLSRIPKQNLAGGFWAKITGNSGATHSWALQNLAGGVFSTPTGGATGTLNAYEAQGRQKVATNTYVWMRAAPDNTFEFDLTTGLVSSPDTISTSTGDAALTDSWDRNSPTGKGLAATLMTRVVYNSSGDEILYGFNRVMTWDSNGELQSVTAETRVTIDDPDDDCTT